MTTPQRRRSYTGPIITLILGVVLMFGAPIIGIFGGTISGLTGLLTATSNTISVDPKASIGLSTGDTVILLVEDPPGDSFDSTLCTLTGPNGESGTVQSSQKGTLTTTSNGVTYRSFATATATADGLQTVDCSAAGRPILMTHDLAAGSVIGPILWWVIAGFALGIVGLVLLILGIVQLVRRTQANKKVEKVWYEGPTEQA